MDSLLVECTIRATLVAVGTAAILWALRIKRAATLHIAVIQQALDDMISERSGGSSAAVLTNPINIGIGTK